jgi:hypothetical protein
MGQDMKDKNKGKRVSKVLPDETKHYSFLHAKWKKLFFGTNEWNSYNTEEAHGTGALSKREQRVLEKIVKFENELRKLSKKFGIRLDENSENEPRHDNDSISEVSQFYPDLAMDIKALLKNNERTRGFSSAMHSDRKPGRVRIIPSFVAEQILVGLAIHRMFDDTGERKEGYSVLRHFFSKDGEFHLWFKEKFNSEELPKTLFSKDKTFITDWAKQLKHELEERVRKRALKIRKL